MVALVMESWLSKFAANLSGIWLFARKIGWIDSSEILFRSKDSEDEL